MKLSQWAKKNSVCYKTAWNIFAAGQIPGAYRLPTGTIVVPEPEAHAGKPLCVITYARVSSSENKDNLIRQSKRLVDFCNANGWGTNLNITEIGSGLNENRSKLIKVLSDGKATRLVVEHKDRLARFGVKYIEILCGHIGCELVVVNPTTTEREDLIQDFVSVITSFCARIYGQRRSKRKTEELIRKLKDDN